MILKINLTVFIGIVHKILLNRCWTEPEFQFVISYSHMNPGCYGISGENVVHVILF